MEESFDKEEKEARRKYLEGRVIRHVSILTDAQLERINSWIKEKQNNGE